MFIGTCRMHDPMNELRGDTRVSARSTTHRLHTTGQILQFIKNIDKTTQWDDRAIHLMSDYAASQIFENGRTRREIIDELEWLESAWATFDVFVVEVSTFREFEADSGGDVKVVGTFADRDQKKYAQQIRRDADVGVGLPVIPIDMRILTEREVIADMAAIKRALRGRPVIWVSHMRPSSQGQRHSVVTAVRKRLADVLRRGAEQTGDIFFDPSEIAAQMGDAKFFKNDGEDLDHLTPAAATRLAQEFRLMITKCGRETN